MRITRTRLLSAATALVVGAALVSAYSVYPAFCRSSATPEEATAWLPGDKLVPSPGAGSTLAVSIEAPRRDVWKWLLRMTQGRTDFYAYEGLQSLLDPAVNDVDAMVEAFERHATDEAVRLLPDPYLGGQPGGPFTVEELSPAKALVLRQTLPSGGIGTWAYVLHDEGPQRTRLVFRRRSSEPSLFDRAMLPGYFLMDMDMDMLSGISTRAERLAQETRTTVAQDVASPVTYR